MTLPTLQVFAAQTVLPGPWLLIVLIIPAAILIALLGSARVKGAVGEWSVKQMLNRKLDRAAYHCLHDLLIPDGRGGLTQIDHVVVSEWGIMVVETKNYSGWIFGTERDERWTVSYPNRRKETIQNPIRQNRLHVCAVERLLELSSGQCHSIVFFTGNAVFKKGPILGVHSSGLAKHIRSFQTAIWDAETAAALAGRLQAACRSDNRKSRAAHLAQVRSRR